MVRASQHPKSIIFDANSVGKKQPVAKIGRPPEMAGGKAVKVYLDAESVAIATRLGNGNVSEGIRLALKKSAE